MYLAKYDSSGNALWAISGGGIANDRGVGVTLDNSGNIYITGIFQDISYFGNFTVVSNGSWDGYVAKYDTSGKCLWINTFGGLNDDRGSESVVDQNGNVYTTGWFRGVAQFENQTLAVTGTIDVCLIKYDSLGNQVWVRTAGGLGFDKSYTISITNDQYVYISGYFLDEADFGPFHLKSYGSRDVFLAKYDVNGTIQWAYNYGGDNYDRSLQITVDEAGHIYVAGHYRNTAIFGEQTITSNGEWDIFLAKIQEDGTCDWVATGGGRKNDMSFGVATGENGHVFLTGTFTDTARIGSFDLYGTITPNALRDMFVAKYDSLGACLWVEKGIGPGDHQLANITNAGPAGFYITADFSQDLTIANDFLPNSNDYDMMLGRFKDCTSIPVHLETSTEFSIVPGQDTTVAAEVGFLSYVWSTGEQGRSINVMQPGHYYVVAVDSNGCSSAAHLDIWSETINCIKPEAGIGLVSQIKVLPNPASEILIIRSELDNYSFEIFDMLGCSVYFRQQLPMGNTTLGLPQLLSGVYYYKVVQTSHFPGYDASSDCFEKVKTGKILVRR